MYLHIGLSKTGSSALQSWLSLNAKELIKQGVFYADLSPSAKNGRITAGNGVRLFNACNNENFSEIERLISSVYSCHECDRFIVSSEALQNIPRRSIIEIRDFCEKNDIEVVVVAYVRSAYELFYSNYLQGVKRHGFSHKFGEKGRFSYSAQLSFLQNYFEVFPSTMVVRNYDLDKNDIFLSFSSVVGIEKDKTVINDKVVKRSLTFKESDVLRKLNSIHNGVFSTEISNFLISKKPDKKTKVYYRDDLLSKVRLNCSNDIEWVNSIFFKSGDGLALDFYNAHVDVEEPCEDVVIYEFVVEWCLSCGKEKKDEGFVEFVRDFAVLLENVDLNLSFSLMKKAKELRPNGPFINKKLYNYSNKLGL